MDIHCERHLDADPDEVTEGRQFSRWTRIWCLLTIAIFVIASCGDDRDPLLPVGPSAVPKNGEGDREWDGDGYPDDDTAMLNAVGEDDDDTIIIKLEISYLTLYNGECEETRWSFA